MSRDASNAAGAKPERIAERLDPKGKRLREATPAERSGRHLRGPLVPLMDGRGIGGVLDLALVRQRRRNGGYSDLAVAAVETRFVAAGVFTGLRRIVLGHCLLRGNSNSHPFACGRFRSSLRWRASAAEMRNKSCPIVTFQTERKGEISLRPVAVEIDVEAALRPLVCL